jgi:hypothetical protein
VKGDGGSMGRGEASRGSARAGPFGRGGGPRTPGSAPGEAGGAVLKNDKTKEYISVQNEGWTGEGRRRRRLSACRGRDDGNGLEVRHGLPLTESVLYAAAAARPTAGSFQSIPRNPHTMEAGTAWLRGRPHSVMRARVVFDCTAPWTLLGLHVARGRRSRRRRRGWLACSAGGGGNFD